MRWRLGHPLLFPLAFSFPLRAQDRTNTQSHRSTNSAMPRPTKPGATKSWSTKEEVREFEN
jgi:hypothetical protein